MPPLPPPPLPPPVVVMDASWTPGTPAGTWADGSLPVTFVLARAGTRDVGAAVAAELDVAARTWSLPSCTRFRARYGGVDPRAAADDGVNVVLVHEDAWPPELEPGAVAQTVIHLAADGRYRDADIHLNGVDWRFSLDAAPGTLDLRSILVHEIGHALGLGHAAVASATMAASGSGLRWRSLEAADVEGVCALYPGTGALGCPDAACPDGFVCAARRCQRAGGEPTAVCAPCDPQEAGACEAAGDLARCAELTPGGPRACARPCTTGESCGPGYTCRATSEAGDLQCVADDGCTAAGVPCADGGCEVGSCTAGVCLGVATRGDAGTDADAGADAIPVADATGSSCTCRSAGRANALGPFLALSVAVTSLLLRRRRQSR